MIASLLAIALQSGSWVIPPLPDKSGATPAAQTTPSSAQPPAQSRTFDSAPSGTDAKGGRVTSVVVGAPGIGWTRGPGPVRCSMMGTTTGSKVVPVVTMRPATPDGSVTAAITDPGSAWQFLRVQNNPTTDAWIAAAIARYGAEPAVVLRPEKGECRYDAVLVYTDDDGEFARSRERPRLSPLVQCPPLSCLKESIDKLRADNQLRRATEMAACSDQKQHPTNKVVVVAFDKVEGRETVSVVDRAAATRSYFTGVSPYSCISDETK